jgi:tetratricopeptide (TPR) repeat protein
MALQGRWQQAAKRYEALIKIDKLDGTGVVALDYQAYGVVLAELGDAGQYQLFCQAAVANFGGAENGGVLKTCLLFPVDAAQLAELRPLADKEAQFWASKQEVKNSDWAWIPFSLWEYRRGDYDGSLKWCQQGLAQKVKFPACDAVLHIILAMSYYQRGQTDEACSELAQGRQLVEAKFKKDLDRGRSGVGYWHDWIFARHLLQEAGTLVDCQSLSPETE